MLTRVFLCAALFTRLAFAQQSVLPLIADVVDNAAGSQITVNGSGFGKLTPSVNLAGTNLTVVKYSDTQIVAAVPTSIAPGSYALFITNGLTHLAGYFDVRLALRSARQVLRPQGPQGVAGP